MKQLTQISSLSSDLVIKENRIYLTNITSNVSIVELTGSGYYDPEDNSIDFIMQPHPFGALLNLPLIRLVTSPATGLLLKRRLTGTIDKPKWESLLFTPPTPTLKP